MQTFLHLVRGMFATPLPPSMQPPLDLTPSSSRLLYYDLCQCSGLLLQFLKVLVVRVASQAEHGTFKLQYRWFQVHINTTREVQQHKMPSQQGTISVKLEGTSKPEAAPAGLECELRAAVHVADCLPVVVGGIKCVPACRHTIVHLVSPAPARMCWQLSHTFHQDCCSNIPLLPTSSTSVAAFHPAAWKTIETQCLT